MRIRLLRSVAGPHYSYRRSWVGEVPDRYARELINSGDAIAVDDSVPNGRFQLNPVEYAVTVPDDEVAVIIPPKSINVKQEVIKARKRG